MEQREGVRQIVDSDTLGRENEQRVLWALEGLARDVPWLVEVRQATREEDDAGVDIVCVLDNGKYAYVQVKSSRTYELAFESDYRVISLGVLPLTSIVAKRAWGSWRIARDLSPKLLRIRDAAMRIDPAKWIKCVNDMRSISRRASQRHIVSDQVGAYDLARRINHSPSIVGPEAWIVSARLLPTDPTGIGNGGLVLIETVDGANLMIKVLTSRDRVRELTTVIAYTYFQGAIVVTQGLNPQGDDEELRSRLDHWRRVYYAFWQRRVQRDRC